LKTPDIKSLSAAPSAAELELGTAGLINIPEPQADIIEQTYANGIKQKLDNVYKKQLEVAQKELDRITKELDRMTAEQEKALDEQKELTQPFRVDFEAAARKRLEIDDLLRKNLDTINEMETILTTILEDVRAAEAVTGLKSIRAPRIAKIKEDALGRISILESVLAARKDQIELSFTSIDRGLVAQTADKQDQISYFQTVYDFYKDAKERG